MPGQFQQFLGELKRRKVFHVAAAYIVVGIGVVEGAQIIGSPLGLPDWVLQALALLVVLGFPISLVLAWAYELHPDPGAPGEGIEPSQDHTTSAVAKDHPVPGPLPRDRIAVLPFASIHPDREHDYFSDGITEELISAISRIQGLDVIARTSVSKYKDSDARISEIGRDLNVGVVLEGSVRKAGNELRITVQLINAESEGHLWAEDYDRSFSEIFAVQRDIASHVANALRHQLLTPDAERIGKAPTGDFAAYDLYLLGRHHLNHRSDAGIRKAISSFERAVDLDGEFALGYAGLADAYILAVLGYMSDPPEDVLLRAKANAQHALGLNEDLSEAHTSLGYSALLAWDGRTAEKELRRAIELNPSHSQAHQWMGHVLIWLDRAEEAIIEFERALELDPLSAVLTLEVGFGYHYAWKSPEALDYTDRALEMDPNLPIAHYNRALNLLRLDRYEEAVESFGRALELLPSMPYGRAFLAAAYAQHGREDAAGDILSKLVKEDSDSNPIRTFIAVAQEGLGLKEEALASIRQAVDRREPVAPLISLAWLPFHSLESTPEFRSLVDEMNGIIGR